MSFIEDFQENAAGRIAAYAFATVAALGLTGCASIKNAEVGAIPVGRVVTQSVIRGTMPARQAARNEVAGALRLTACPGQATAEPAEPTLWGAFKKSILPTVEVTIGDANCTTVQPPAGAAGAPVGPRPRGQ